VDDSNLGLFSEAYVRNRIREQAMLARRHKTELAILACIMDGEYPEEMRGKLAVIVSCAIRTSVRGSDGVAYFEGQKAFVTVLPGSDEEGALIVARKIAAHLDALALVDNEGRLLPNMRWRPLRVTGEEKEEEIYQRLFNRQDRTEETAA
jgi:PleD family two-component response regulator